jgi:hypothetical protein
MLKNSERQAQIIREALLQFGLQRVVVRTHQKVRSPRYGRGLRLAESAFGSEDGAIGLPSRNSYRCLSNRHKRPPTPYSSRVPAGCRNSSAGRKICGMGSRKNRDDASGFESVFAGNPWERLYTVGFGGRKLTGRKVVCSQNGGLLSGFGMLRGPLLTTSRRFRARPEAPCSCTGCARNPPWGRSHVSRLAPGSAAHSLSVGTSSVAWVLAPARNIQVATL